MTKQFYIKLQTPTVELPVTATDASGKTETIQVGFKRYSLDQLEAKFNETTDLTESDMDFLTKEIIYIKNGTLEVYDDGKYLEDFIVKDTREVEPNEFFQDTKDALVVLLGYYLNSSPWKDALIAAYTNSVKNMGYKDGELKN